MQHRLADTQPRIPRLANGECGQQLLLSSDLVQKGGASRRMGRRLVTPVSALMPHLQCSHQRINYQLSNHINQLGRKSKSGHLSDCAFGHMNSPWRTQQTPLFPPGRGTIPMLKMAFNRQRPITRENQSTALLTSTSVDLGPFEAIRSLKAAINQTKSCKRQALYQLHQKCPIKIPNVTSNASTVPLRRQ